jgi:DNA-binding transcriptional LysR family regulator
MVDNLRSLRAFVAVAETLNFRQAAERLHISQPPLTRLIAAMERDLGVQLMERTTRRVALTTHGELMLGEARKLLAHADKAARTLRHHLGDRRRLVIGCTSAAFFSPFPALVAKLRQEHPDLNLEIQERHTEAQLAGLVSAELDVGVLLLPVAHPALEIRQWSTIRMQIAVPTGHAVAVAAGDGPVPLEAFAKDNFIVHEFDENPAMYQEILQACQKAGFRPKVRIKRTGENCMGLVMTGMGVHFTMSDGGCMKLPGVRFLDLEGQAPELRMAVAWRRDDPSPLVREFHHRILHDPAG